MRDLVAWHLPGLVLAACAIHAALLVYAFGRRAGLEEAPLEPGSFATFRTPLAAAAAFIPAGALAALADGLAARAAVVILIPLGTLFFLRGMAIIRALLDRGRVGLLIRAPVYVLAVQMPIPVLVAIGGLLDEFLDFRGRFSRGDRRERATADREEGSRRNMSDVKVILTDEVRGLGNRGEVVSVAAGYARNFLLPKELAYLATPGNVKRLEQEKKRYDVSQAKEKDQAATVAKAFEGLSVTVRKKAGDHDAIYGSVTASELAAALAAKGITVDRRRIDLEEPIKRLGTAHGPRPPSPRGDRDPQRRGRRGVTPASGHGRSSKAPPRRGFRRALRDPFRETARQPGGPLPAEVAGIGGGRVPFAGRGASSSLTSAPLGSPRFGA